MIRAAEPETRQANESPRFHRILVVVDGTAEAAFALRNAIPRVVDQYSQLTVLEVVPKPSNFNFVALAGASPYRLAAEMETEADVRLRDLAAAMPKQLSITTLLRRGNRVDETLGVLDEGVFDLLCMVTGVPGRVREVLRGSVSAAVLRHSPVPVMLFRPDPSGREGLVADSTLASATREPARSGLA
jgi:nucleotide-binding universal stress UspA family protein